MGGMLKSWVPARICGTQTYEFKSQTRGVEAFSCSASVSFVLSNITGIMFNRQVDRLVRALKDPAYRASLGEEAPDHPAGAADLSDEELLATTGGEVAGTWDVVSICPVCDRTITPDGTCNAVSTGCCSTW